MPKVSPLKLIDEAIVPAFLVFGAKLFGLFLAGSLFNLTWQPELATSKLPNLFMSFVIPSEGRLANDLATFCTSVVIALGFGWVLFRSHYLNLTQLHPFAIKKHVSSGREHLLVDTYEIYHQAAIWLALNWLIFLLSCLDFIAGNLSPLVFALALSITLTLFLALLVNVNRELSSAKE